MSFRLRGDFTPVSRKLEQLKIFRRQVKDLRPLAEKIKRELIAANKQAALAGQDKRNQSYVALRPSTIATRRGNGPPLAPRGANSRVVKNFTVDYTIKDGGITFRAGWVNADFMRYHFTGYTHRSGTKVPERNPNGVRPTTMTNIRSISSKHFKDTARMAFRTTPNNGVA